MCGLRDLLVAVGDAALGEVVGADVDRDAVAQNHLDAEATELAGEVGLDGHLVAVGVRVGLHQELATGVHLDHLAFERNQIITSQVSSWGRRP